MKLPFKMLPVVVFLVGACSSNDGEITVESRAEPLTSGPGDPLFTLTLADAASEGYAVSDLVVKATPEDKSAVTLVCNVNDTNGNARLDAQETMSCAEGANNDFGPELAGKAVEVELFAKIDGEEERIGDADWTPK